MQYIINLMKKVDNKYRSFPFWSWNDKLDKKELIKQIDWMHENGIGGFFMHARGGLTTPYLGDDWFECINACQKRAQELGMEAYAYDENGWPSGFVGGKLLDDPENHDLYIISSVGEYDAKADVSYDISSEKLVRASKGNNVLNLYLKNSACTADVCSRKVVDKFITMTHEQYKKHDKYGNLVGFFTDEPQYYRWSTAYTRVLPNYFKEQYADEITLKTLESFKSYLLFEREVQNSTINRYRALLSKVYNIAIANKNNTSIFMSHSGLTAIEFGGNKHITKEDYLWDRSHYYAKTYYGPEDTVIIHGHTPIRFIAEELGIEEPQGAIWYANNHKCCIDCGAHFTAHTVLMNLNTFEEEVIK